jgi:hypothetical protein
MPELSPLPKYLLILVSLPRPPLITMGGLDERVMQLASEVYPTAPREEPSGEALRHNVTKLLMARWGQIDPSKYALITCPVSDKDERICIAQIKRWEENIQTNWVSVSSWLQQLVAGAICRSDYQVIINNLNRNVKLLSLAPQDEQHTARMRRCSRGCKYKKALRVHRDHIQLGAQREIAEAEQALKAASGGEASVAARASTVPPAV